MLRSKKTGEEFEKLASSHLHIGPTPILVSPLVLRRRGLGQVDLAYMQHGKIYAAECKSGGAKVSGFQFKRLCATAKFLTLVLKKRIHLIGIQQVAKVNAGDYPFKVCNIRELM